MKVINQRMYGDYNSFFVQNVAGGNRSRHRLVEGKLSAAALRAAAKNASDGGPVFGGRAGAEAAHLWQEHTRTIASSYEIR